MTPKKQKHVNNSHKQVVPLDEDIHQFHILLDMIDCPVNINDYNIPQIHPQPVEPTQSVVEIKEPVLARPTATPPPLEAIKEEDELETEQQQQQEEEEEESQVGASNLIPVTMENLEIAKNKPCINNCIGIEISEYDDTDLLH